MSTVPTEAFTHQTQATSDLDDAREMLDAAEEDWRISDTLREIQIAEAAVQRSPGNRLFELELISLRNRLAKLRRQAAS